MKILALSTSTSRGSAAVLEDDELLGEARYVDLKGHAERLLEAVDEALAAAGLDRRAIDVVACDVGPGSFTGVRVGVATGKGIAIALGAPMAAVGSLEAMAAAAFGDRHATKGEVVIACIDAKKSEVFVASYELTDRLEIKPIVAPAHVRIDASPFAIVRPGARAIVAGEIASRIGCDLPNPRGPALDLPDAAWIGRLAFTREKVDPELVDPLYVRAPDADRALVDPNRR